MGTESHQKNIFLDTYNFIESQYQKLDHQLNSGGYTYLLLQLLRISRYLYGHFRSYANSSN
jgi:hypothetical protein